MALTPKQEAKFWKGMARVMRNQSPKTIKRWFGPGAKLVQATTRLNFERKRSESLGKFARNKLSTLKAKGRRHGLKTRKRKGEVVGLRGFKKIKGPTGKEIRASKGFNRELLKAMSEGAGITNLIGSRGVGVDSGRLAKLYRSNKLIRFHKGGFAYGEAINRLTSKGGHRYAVTFSKGKKDQIPRPLNELANKTVSKMVVLIANEVIRDFSKRGIIR